MKKICTLLIVLCLSNCGGMNAPTALPMGTWNYTLTMNGTEIGSATVTSGETEKSYISTVNMSMSLGPVKNTSRQIVTESKTFEPQKLEVYNKIINGEDVQEINTMASFKGREVTVTAGGKTAKAVIETPFILDGNFFMHSMLEKKFQKGSHVEANMYDPSFELEGTIRVKVQVMGTETVSINGKDRTLLHVKQIIENFKNIDIYLDEKGITQKARILMLNNKIELVIKE